MARQSAWRTTQITDQKMTAKSHRKTTIIATGCATISTNRLPAAKKIAAVPKPISSANSARIMRRQSLASRVDPALSDIGASISSPSDDAIGRSKGLLLLLHKDLSLLPTAKP